MEFDLNERVKEQMTEEMGQPEGMMWLSFADDAAEGFKGVVIIRAHGLTDALMKCNVMKINPGGEVSGHMIPEEYWDRCPLEVQNKLLSKVELQQHFGKLVNTNGEPV
jgi:hypothetical protein